MPQSATEHVGHTNRPRALDLYAGAGGLSLGMEQAGFDVVGAVEFDAIHALTHKFNFPHVPVLRADIGQLDIQAIRDLCGLDLPGSGPLDAIVGGPPCQGFSAGGLRNEADDRNEQLTRFVDIVVALQPRVFCLENVAGLLESRFKALRDRVLERLTRAGYAVSGLDSPVNAMNFGVPQSRRRVLVLGSLTTAPRLVEPMTGDRPNVADALNGLPDVSSYDELLHADTAQLRPEDLERLRGATSAYARRLASLDPVDDLGYPRAVSHELLTNSRRTVHQDRSQQRFAQTLQGSVEPVSRLYRLSLEGVSRTLRAGTGSDRGSHTSPRPIHPLFPRVITVREAARLHGYPDWFQFHTTNWHGHRQVGNSVPPPLAAAAGRALIQVLDAKLTKPTGPLAIGKVEWLSLPDRLARKQFEMADTPSEALTRAI